MHEWHTNTSRNPLKLINEFEDFEYRTDWGGMQKNKQVKMTGKIFTNEEDAINFVTGQSYYSGSAYMAAYTQKKLSKGYQNAYADFIKKQNEYLKFRDNLTIAYGRKANKVTCPDCGSSISLKYGARFTHCPVCMSSKIISDSNWNILETKERMAKKAAENVSKEAEKIDLCFVCGIEWHC